MSFRFPRSLRKIEEVYYSTLNHKTVWQWALKSDREIADHLRRREPHWGD